MHQSYRVREEYLCCRSVGGPKTEVANDADGLQGNRPEYVP